MYVWHSNKHKTSKCHQICTGVDPQIERTGHKNAIRGSKLHTIRRDLCARRANELRVCSRA